MEERAGAGAWANPLPRSPAAKRQEKHTKQLEGTATWRRTVRCASGGWRDRKRERGPYDCQEDLIFTLYSSVS